VKIITEADKVKQKALNKPSRAINLGNMESEFGATEQSYVQNIIDQHRAKLNMHSYDRDIEEPRLRDSLVKAGVLLADKAGNVVRDARITPKEERKLVEFASRMTEGDRDLVVEFADGQATVFRKSTGDADMQEMVEFADVAPAKETRQRVFKEERRD
jgi:hypothetical protein